MKILCKDRFDKLKGSSRTARGVSSVASDVDRMFSTKSYQELETLEKQIRGKLDSDEDIDVDYWEHLLKTLLVWKAKAKLRDLSHEIVQGRLQNLRKEQEEEAQSIRQRLAQMLEKKTSSTQSDSSPASKLDPEPFLKLRSEDKSREIVDEADFLEKVNQERNKVLKLGYVPMKKGKDSSVSDWSAPNESLSGAANEDDSNATSLLYERELARGVDENEEIFTGEEIVDTASKAQWSDKYRPRKPKYFNRVQMGYEWNKYNQTHYDHDNPPPKVVQGYKFNIFYPDLINPTKAPTYRIEREGGRKRGQTFAQAGEEDTCLIRFIAGPPYEDIAFRIVDREWDYSAKRERGFKSSFEKGILQLHFQFKKVRRSWLMLLSIANIMQVYYRK
jgi:Cactus-binding C-terminus of cactin protein/Conserved mid region of cactin